MRSLRRIYMCMATEWESDARRITTGPPDWAQSTWNDIDRRHLAFFFFFLALHTFFFKGGTKEEQDQKWKRKRNKSLVGFSFISPVKQLSEKMKNKGEQTHISSKSSNGQWHSDIKRSSIYPAKRSKVADNSPASGWHTSSFNIIVWRSCVCRPLHVIHYSVGTVHTMERRHFSAAQLKVVRCHRWDRE